jgi:hypothetical protein
MQVVIWLGVCISKYMSVCVIKDKKGKWMNGWMGDEDDDDYSDRAKY